MTASVEVLRPCSPSPCGINALCTEQNGAGSCQCMSDYIGNPYEGCRPECVVNTDCAANLACIRSKCQNPCVGTCGQNAECQVINHLPSCTCMSGFTGDPFRSCNVARTGKQILESVWNKYSVQENHYLIFIQLWLLLTFATRLPVDQTVNAE